MLCVQQITNRGVDDPQMRVSGIGRAAHLTRRPTPRRRRRLHPRPAEQKPIASASRAAAVRFAGAFFFFFCCLDRTPSGRPSAAAS